VKLFEIAKPKLEKIPERIKAFIAELRSLTEPHPFDRGIRLYKNVGLDVENYWDTEAHLKSIISFEEKGAGQATEALKFLLALADKHQVPITLEVVPIKNAGAEGKSLTKTELAAWYKRHGFVGNSLNMVRMPN
jgi:hypothetical protein